MNNLHIAELETNMRRRLDSIPVRIRPFTYETESLPRAFLL